MMWREEETRVREEAAGEVNCARWSLTGGFQASGTRPVDCPRASAALRGDGVGTGEERRFGRVSLVHASLFSHSLASRHPASLRCSRLLLFCWAVPQ